MLYLFYISYKNNMKNKKILKRLQVNKLANLGGLKSKYYDFTFFSTNINFDKIEKLEEKGEKYLFQNLLFLFKKYNKSKKDENLLINAFELAKDVHKKQRRESGATFVTHPLIVALLALPYKPCVDFLSATILHDVIEDYNCENNIINNNTDDEKYCRDYISNKIKLEFGETIYNLIEGVSKVSEIKNLEYLDKKTQKSVINNKTIEKIFQHSGKDFRILLIKIFDRLHNIITIAGKKDPVKRKKKVEEAISIYLASAKRLGVWDLKKLLENACNRALHISNDIEKKDNTYIIDKIKKYIKFKNITDIFDENYILIEVEKKEDCYVVFSELNKTLYLKKNTFTDYIAKPKINQYKALHAQYIIGNSDIVNIHIVSSEMQKRNNLGVFVDAEKKDFKLKISSDASFDLIKKKILTPQITIHNKEFGTFYFPKGATALDVGIFLYKQKFQYIESVKINDVNDPLYTPLQNNDIVEFVFSKNIKFTRDWLDYSEIYKSIISQNLSLFNRDIKIEVGHDILQDIFDEKHLGTVDIKCENKDFLHFINPKYKDINDLYIDIYEGKIRGYKCVSLFEKFINKEKKNENSELIQKKLQFSSYLSTISKVEFLFSTIAKKEKIKIKSLKIEKNTDNLGINGTVNIESVKTNISHFILSLKPAIQCVYPISLSFLLKAFFYLAFPFAIAFLIFSLIIFGVSLPSLWFYSGAIVMLTANIFGYIFFHAYFAKIRNNMHVLLLVIVFNFSLSLGYIYLFFEYDYDIYNLNFYFPLILLVFSMALPAFFASKKKSNQDDENRITISEYKKKQKEKIIGYLLRFSAIVVWGLDPLLLKYSPLSEIPLDIRMGLLFFGGVLFMLSVILVFKRNVIKSLYKIPINGAFKLLIIAKLLFAFLSVVSLQYTSGTSFILLNNFAPIFSLLIAFIFWRSSVVYLNDKKNVAKMFVIFLLGSIGTSLIFYKDIVSGGVLSFWGNIFAILTMLSDVLFMTVVIKYAPSLKDNQSYFVNFYLYLASFLCFLPFLLFNILDVLQLSIEKIFWALGVGALWGLGTLLNYEAFRRMDGFIGFLMFNLAILITISVESFFLKEIEITPFLLFGSALVITASILAEMINTKCEKENIIADKN